MLYVWKVFSMEYKPDKEKIVKRIAGFFKEGDYVNLGIGLPTKVGNYIPDDGSVVLQSENGFLGLGPAPKEGEEIEKKMSQVNLRKVGKVGKVDEKSKIENRSFL